MNQLQPLVGLYSVIVKFNLDVTNTYLSGVRRMRQSQLDQISAIGSDVESLGQQIEGAQDIGALNSVHASLLDSGIERASTYWGQCAKDMSAMQTELSDLWQHRSSKTTNDMRQQWKQVQSTVSQGLSNILKPVMASASEFAFATSPQDSAGDGEQPAEDASLQSTSVRTAAAPRRTGR